MPALQVRDLPEETYNRLRNLAQREHRSIAQQTVVALQSYLESIDERPIGKETEKEVRVRQRREIFNRIDSRRPPKIPDDFPSSAELVREDRESR